MRVFWARFLILIGLRKWVKSGAELTRAQKSHAIVVAVRAAKVATQHNIEQG